MYLWHMAKVKVKASISMVAKTNLFANFLHCFQLKPKKNGVRKTSRDEELKKRQRIYIHLLHFNMICIMLLVADVTSTSTGGENA